MFPNHHHRCWFRWLKKRWQTFDGKHQQQRKNVSPWRPSHLMIILDDVCFCQIKPYLKLEHTLIDHHHLFVIIILSWFPFKKKNVNYFFHLKKIIKKQAQVICKLLSYYPIWFHFDDDNQKLMIAKKKWCSVIFNRLYRLINRLYRLLIDHINTKLMNGPNLFIFFTSIQKKHPVQQLVVHRTCSTSILG